MAKQRKPVKKNREYYEDEFFRLLDILIHQGDIDVISDMITYAQKKSFVDGWHENDWLDQNEKDAQEYKDFKRCAD